MGKKLQKMLKAEQSSKELGEQYDKLFAFRESYDIFVDDFVAAQLPDNVVVEVGPAIKTVMEFIDNRLKELREEGLKKIITEMDESKQEVIEAINEVMDGSALSAEYKTLSDRVCDVLDSMSAIAEKLRQNPEH